MLRRPSKRPFYIFGHRGAIYKDGRPYQNSLPAFQEALTFADGFETDACRTKDDEIVFIHEAKYYRPEMGVEYCATEHLDKNSKVRFGRNKIEETLARDLRHMKLKDGSSIPTFYETLTLFHKNQSKIIDIELKGYDVSRALLPRLKDYFAKALIKEDQIILSSFNHNALPGVRSLIPTVTLGAIFCSPDTPPSPLYPWHPTDRSYYLPLTRENLTSSVLRESAPDLIIVPEEILTSETFDLIIATHPSAQIFAWVFTEKTKVDDHVLIKKITELSNLYPLIGIMVDTTRSFSEASDKMTD